MKAPVPGTRGGLHGPRLVDATGWEPARWDALAVHSPRGHVFQSHAWGELKRPLGWTPLRFVVEMDGEPAGVLSIQERRVARRMPGPLGRIGYMYAPRGPVLLRADADGAGAVLESLARFARSREALALTIDPAWTEGGPEMTLAERGGWRAAPRDVQVSRTAMVVPLLEDEGAQHALLGKSMANYVNRARRLGVAVERADPFDSVTHGQALDDFWRMLEATARRAGFVLRDRAYQVRQWHALCLAGLAQLWFARAGDRRICGSMLLVSGDRLLQYEAGSLDDADLNNLRANHLLQWEIIRRSADGGFTTYDMGGVDNHDAPGIPADSSHPLWSLYVFKRAFGARPVLYARALEYAPRALYGLTWRGLRRFRG
jgi:peptidoglycan pentaglycine glycine transferase (the first glycine)